MCRQICSILFAILFLLQPISSSCAEGQSTIPLPMVFAIAVGSASCAVGITAVAFFCREFWLQDKINEQALSIRRLELLVAHKDRLLVNLGERIEGCENVTSAIRGVMDNQFGLLDLTKKNIENIHKLVVSCRVAADKNRRRGSVPHYMPY